MLGALLQRIWATFRRRRLDEELDQEVQDHLALLAERFVRGGMKPDEAVYAARRQFGGVTQVKQDLRSKRALPVAALMQDLRHAFRQLRKSKGFTAWVALTLALGIGCSTAVFAVLDAVVLKPLPFAAPDRLMAVQSIDRRGTPHPSNMSYPNFFDFRAQNSVFEHLVSYRGQRFTLSESTPAVQLVGLVVSWDLFAALGATPELGRGFLKEEEKPGIHVTILSHALWKSRFAGDRDILGKRIRIDGNLFTVVGVAPVGFQFPEDAPPVELWTTLAEDASGSDYTPLTAQRGARVMDAIGRLKPGVTREQSQAQMDGISGALALQYPDDDKNVDHTSVIPEQERLAGSSRKLLWVMLGAVGLVLLIGCGNVANLLLARSTERAREFTLRTALGASRAALVRQVLVESLALAVLGSAGGVSLAWLALKLVLPLAGSDIPIPRIAQSAIDARVFVFSIAITLVTCVLFSLAPAAQVLRADLVGVLKEGASNIVRGRHGVRSLLVVGQITLGLALLVGAELLIANFVYLVQRDPGFRPGHLLTFEIGLSEAKYDRAGRILFCDRVLERLRAIPGVETASAGSPLPLEGHEMSVSFNIEERPAAAPERPHSDIAIVSPGYFSTMGIRFLKGRDFTDRDDTKTTRVVVVNEAFARKYFPGEDVIGKRIEPGATNGNESSQKREIVGVVANAKQAAWDAESDPIYYFPFKQLSWYSGAYVLRTAGAPQDTIAAAREAVMGLDREAPMFKIQTGDELSAAAITVPRFLMALMSGFAGIALMLTMVGLYGVLSYSVARRRREIGVRMALGAGRRQVLGLVLSGAMQSVGLGLLLGLICAAGVQKLMESIVFGIRPKDPLFIAIACGAMVIAGVVAASAPAMRAASVDPVRALRSE